MSSPFGNPSYDPMYDSGSGNTGVSDQTVTYSQTQTEIVNGLTYSQTFNYNAENELVSWTIKTVS